MFEPYGEKFFAGGSFIFLITVLLLRRTSSCIFRLVYYNINQHIFLKKEGNNVASNKGCCNLFNNSPIGFVCLVCLDQGNLVPAVYKFRQTGKGRLKNRPRIKFRGLLFFLYDYMFFFTPNISFGSSYFLIMLSFMLFFFRKIIL